MTSYKRLFSRALKAAPATADIPVIMITIVDDKNLGIALGAADYFTKPIDWQRLGAVCSVPIATRHRGRPSWGALMEDVRDGRAQVGSRGARCR